MLKMQKSKKPRVDSGEGANAQTFVRAFMLLRSVAARKGDGASLSDLIASSGLTKPTVRRLLISLMDNGLVEQDPESRRYYVGPEVYALGLLAASRFEAPPEIAESVRTLARESDDAAMLSVEQGHYALCTLREDGNFPLRTHALQPGNRHPLGVGAAGLALLSARSDNEIDEILRKSLPQIISDYPQVNEDGIREEIKACRTRGYSLNTGLVVPGSWGIAIAMQDPRNGVPFALTIAAVQSRFEGGRLQKLAEMLKEEGRQLRLRLQSGVARPWRQSDRSLSSNFG
jgi:DNA-binding IclR family transcriptional regulator